MTDNSSVRCTPKKLSQTKISVYLTGCIKTIPFEKHSPSKRSGVRRSRKRLSFSSTMSTDTCRTTSDLVPSSAEVSANEMSIVSSIVSSIPKRKLPAPIFSEDEDSENDASTTKSPKRRTKNNGTKSEPKVMICLNKPTPVTGMQKKILNSTPLSSTNENQNLSHLKTQTEKNTDNAKNIKVLQDVIVHSSKDPQNAPHLSPQKNLLTSPKNISEKRSTCLSPERNSATSLNNLPSEKKSVSPGTSAEKNSVAPNTSPQKQAKTLLQKIPTTTATPKKLQQDGVKDEIKKVNYEQLRVLREFFINVMKHKHLGSLISGPDKEFLYKFFNLDKNYQYVCVKLFLWKPIWYNIFRFVEKIGLTMPDREITDMYESLKNSGFVDTEYMVDDTFTLLNILSLKDVRDIARTFRFTNVSGTKDEIISKLLKNCKTQVTLTSAKNIEQVLRERIKERMGFCVKLSPQLNKSLYCVYLLNTFTNSSLLNPQDYFTNITYFNTVFPSCKIENFSIFYTPQEFSRYADAVKLRYDLDKALEKRNVTHIYEICKDAYNMLQRSNPDGENSFDSSRQPHLEKFTPDAQYISIISSGAKQITTTYYDQVMIWFEYLLSQKFCRHKRGHWYVHLSLIYTTYIKNYIKAAKLLIKAFKEEKHNFSDLQIQELIHRGKMLNKKTYNVPPLFHDEIAALSPPSCDRDWPKDVLDGNSVTSDESNRRRLYAHRCENGDVSYLTVEETALKYYQTSGFPSGEHCEGKLIIASFCLLFWDIIYETYVKGTFVSNLQNAPLDMYTEYFYINREKVIEKRLISIQKNWKDEELRKRLINNWNLHSHETSLCQMDAVIEGPELLYTVIICIGRSILAKIFERLVKNFKLYHSGFPDLIVWNQKEKQAKFVEVKSENDKLSTKQKLWLNYLIDIGASVAVCHVEPKASKKKLKSMPAKSPSPRKSKPPKDK